MYMLSSTMVMAFFSLNLKAKVFKYTQLSCFK